MNKLIILNPIDNVATVLTDINSGETISNDNLNVTAVELIEKYHKIALKDIPEGEYCYKYGNVIGVATKDISAGQHVHTHNIQSVNS
ncbi:MAG: UxaA family hydrolase [Clostridiales bacterium]|jgi:altronate dehydratase small subunit|nr:UxaA family hydrolase [Clostridiales bacterium]